jgi:hypothetical protein
MKQFIIYVILLLLAITPSVHCQKYNSIFSKDTTQWNVFECAPDAGGTFAYYSFSDTIINSKIYNIIYKEMLYSPSQVLGNDSYISGYIREDTINGKWWSLENNNNQYQEVLFMDLNLLKGDYFPFFNQYQQPDSALVDTVYYQNGRKVIEINKLHGDCRNIYKTLFIEGIGPTSGFEEIGRFSLICKLENNNHVFSTQSDVNGNCFLEGAADIKSVKNEDLITLYPNPANNILTIKSSNCNKQPIVIYDSQGTQVKKLYLDENEIKLDISNYHSGIYIIRIDSLSCKFTKQ